MTEHEGSLLDGCANDDQPQYFMNPPFLVEKITVEGEIVGRVIAQAGHTTTIDLTEFTPQMLARMETDRILALLAAAGFLKIGTEDDGAI